MNRVNPDDFDEARLYILANGALSQATQTTSEISGVGELFFQKIIRLENLR